MSEVNKQKEDLPQKIALIICNGNPPPEKLLHQLWQEADYRVAADGGANQLYCYNLVPDAVVGDFDSIKPEVRKKLPNSKLFHVKEQDTNDADKAVRHCLKRECTEIHILGAEGSRNDQFLSSLEILFKYTPNVRLIFVDSAGTHGVYFLTTGKRIFRQEQFFLCCRFSAVLKVSSHTD